MRRHPGKKIESMASIFILGGVVPLCVAILVQYGLHIPPCHFCLLQRYPYGVAIACGIVSLLVPRMCRTWKITVLLGALAFLATGMVGAYHTGIERGWIEYHGGCVADHSAAASLEALRQQVLGAPRVTCNDAVVNVAGLSMASWNSIFAFTMILLVALQYRFEKKNHAPTHPPASR